MGAARLRQRVSVVFTLGILLPGPEVDHAFASQSPKGKGTKYAPGHGPVVPQQCPETGSGWIMGGPLWSQPIHDAAWVKGVLDILEVTEVSLPLPCSCQSHDMCETILLLTVHLQQTLGSRQRHALPS